MALTAPPRSKALNEALSWLEFPRLALSSPALLAGPRGNRERVIVLPGFGAGDVSTSALRRYLDYLNYDVSGWQRGTNRGDVLQAIGEMTHAVHEEWQRVGHKINLIGWSLGGYLAREVARELPGCIEQVITLGSPVVGGPKYTQVARAFGDKADLDWIEQMVASRERVPLTVPVTAIYSKYDGIVAWEACIDHKSPNVDHIEIVTTHVGLGFSADVYRIVASRLNKQVSPKP